MEKRRFFGVAKQCGLLSMNEFDKFTHTQFIIAPILSAFSLECSYSYPPPHITPLHTLALLVRAPAHWSTSVGAANQTRPAATPVGVGGGNLRPPLLWGGNGKRLIGLKSQKLKISKMLIKSKLVSLRRLRLIVSLGINHKHKY